MLYFADYHPICDQIENLERQFCSLSGSILEELNDRKIDVKQIRKHIMSLPYRLKREVSQPLIDHASEIRQKMDMDRLIMYLDATIWNFIDYLLLEHIIRQFGSQELRREMEKYLTDLTRFFKQTTVSQLIKYWPGRRETPPNYCELTIRINMDPDRCTLEQLNLLRKDVCKQFLPPLSEFALLLCNVNHGSIVMTMVIAMDLVPVLMTTAQEPESISFFRERSIESFLVRDIQVYPNPDQPASTTSGSEAELSQGNQ